MEGVLKTKFETNISTNRKDHEKFVFQPFKWTSPEVMGI